jgi:hypothetical protein
MGKVDVSNIDHADNFAPTIPKALLRISRMFIET